MIATEIRIGTTDYTVEVYEAGRIVRLGKRDGSAYDVDARGERTTCNCPDFTYRLSKLDGIVRCKHIRAVLDSGLI